VTILIVTCGALAREVISIRDQHGWDAKILAVPALLHNTPEYIPGAIAERVRREVGDFEQVIIVYGDCGTSGALDVALAEIKAERVDGPHCYEQYAGAETFAAMMEEEPGTFFLTDYLAQSFDHLVLERLGLRFFPELRETYFAHYRRIVYLQQRQDPVLLKKAYAAARALDLPLEVRFTGYGALEERLLRLVDRGPQ